MNIKSANDSFGSMLSNGTVLYRDVGFRASPQPIPPFAQPILAVAPQNCPIPLGDRGSNKMLRIKMSGQFGWNPIVFIPENYNRGIVLFVNDEFPDNWTHLVITGNSFKRVEKDDKLVYVGAVFATVAKPYDMDAYLEFRTRMGNVFTDIITDSKRRSLPWSEKVKLVRHIRPPENRPEEKHLFCEELGENGTWFYESVLWGNSNAPAKVAQKASVRVG